VAAWVKRILEVDKAGHSGTLDPKVTGILPVLLGDATRIMETLLLAGKEYICLMRLHKAVPKKRIMEVCREFMGPIYQKPPLKSSVVKERRVRTIYYLDVLEIEEQHVLMRVGCEAGTYIRKLCFDMGLALGCGANMEELRRTRAGPFREDETLVTLHNLTDAMAAWKEKGDESALRRCIQPVEAALAHLPRLVIADNAVDAVCHGAPLAAPGLLSLETDINKGDMVSFFTLKGEAVAVGVAEMASREMLASQSGIIARTERVIMQPNTYPKAWKLSQRDAATAAGNAAKK
jgi:H/ACA ribonucleoprotein complex subunit 4